jgi:large subunit ribosomal protein L30
MAKKLRITQVKSGIGRIQKQRKTLVALGLKKMHQTVVHNDTPTIRGMVNKVSHLVIFEEFEEEMAVEIEETVEPVKEAKETAEETIENKDTEETPEIEDVKGEETEAEETAQDEAAVEVEEDTNSEEKEEE